MLSLDSVMLRCAAYCLVCIAQKIALSQLWFVKEHILEITVFMAVVHIFALIACLITLHRD